MSKEEQYMPLRRSLSGDSDIKNTATLKRFFLTAANVIILIISMIVFGVSWRKNHQSFSHDLQHVTAYSPLYDQFQMQPVHRTVNGSLFNEAHELLREPPSVEVDAAWEKLAKTYTILVSASTIRELGKDPATRLQVPNHWKTGGKDYPVQVDGQHNIHCLNAIRKYAYREYYYPEYQSTRADHTSPLPSLHQAHLSHCLSVLLQTLTCEPSLDLITYKWMNLQANPFPDFNINKKCRDHSQLLDWLDENQLSDEQIDELVEGGPSGKPIQEAPPLLRQWVERGGRAQDNMSLPTEELMSHGRRS